MRQIQLAEILFDMIDKFRVYDGVHLVPHGDLAVADDDTVLGIIVFGVAGLVERWGWGEGNVLQRHRLEVGIDRMEKYCSL